MTLDTDNIATLIRRHIPDAVVTAEDVRGDGAHFSVTVISRNFDGLTRIDQHRLVYQALAGHVNDGSLHALQLTTRTPQGTHHAV